MVGHDQVDDPVFQPLPKQLPIHTTSNRRRTLALRRSIGNRLGLEMQIVRAGLDAHRQPFVSCLAQHLQRQAGREMHNVTDGIDIRGTMTT